MSIESLAPRTETPAPLLPITSAAEPVPATARPDAADSPAAPLSLQERRLRVARELDGRISGLQQDIHEVSEALAESRLATTGSLRELQQRSTSLTSDFLRLGARLAQQGSAQEKSIRQLEQRAGSRLHDIERALGMLTEEIRVQTEGQHELRKGHDTLARLHEHLDRIVNRQGRNLDILSAEFQQRVELLRISIEGLHSQFHAQQESLIRLMLEHEQLSLLTHQLQAQLADLGSRLDTHIDHMQYRLRSQARALATLALLGIGLVTYFQLNPVRVPDDVSRQLTAIVSRQGEQAAMLSAQDRLQRERLATLAQALEAEQRETKRMRQEVRRTNSRLARINREMSALRTAVAAANAKSTDSPPSTPAEGFKDSPAPAGIAMPAAVSGLRPTF